MRIDVRPARTIQHHSPSAISVSDLVDPGRLLSLMQTLLFVTLTQSLLHVFMTSIKGIIIYDPTDPCTRRLALRKTDNSLKFSVHPLSVPDPVSTASPVSYCGIFESLVTLFPTGSIPSHNIVKVGPFFNRPSRPRQGYKPQGSRVLESAATSHCNLWSR